MKPPIFGVGFFGLLVNRIELRLGDVSAIEGNV